MFAQRSSRRAADPPVEVLPGGIERRIVAEVAIELRISPRFSDDGRPEGTCDRPVSIHLDVPAPPSVAEEPEEEIDLAGEFIRAFQD